MNKQAVIREYFSKLGSSTSRAKRRTAAENVKKANAARRAPIERLEKAWLAVQSGSKTLTDAAISPGRCSYYTLRKYAQRRDAGETMEQIKATR